MKKSEVKQGKCYAAKVSGRMATVRIDAENPHGGWDATNITTGKKIRIRSAQRLRHETRGPGEKAKPDLPDRQAVGAKTVEAAEKTDLAKGVKVPIARRKRGGITEANKADAVNSAMQAVAESKKARKATRVPTAAKGRDTGQRRSTSGRMSCLDAAVKVLEEAGEPLNCTAMFDRMHAAGYWTSDKATPHNTIYAAILRECQKKGAESRFRKAGRGLFELTQVAERK